MPEGLGPEPLVAGAPVPIWDRTCWMTLRIRSSVISMEGHRRVRGTGGTCGPSSGSVAGRVDRLAVDVHGVDQADHHGVDRQFLGLGREPGAGPLADQDHLVEA